MNYMYFISSLQQAYQVAQLFQYSNQNPNRNSHRTELHCESTPPRLSNTNLQSVSSNLYSIPHNHLNSEQIESQASMPVPLPMVLTHPTLNNNQSFADNPTDTTNLAPTQETYPTVLKSLKLPKQVLNDHSDEFNKIPINTSNTLPVTCKTLTSDQNSLHSKCQCPSCCAVDEKKIKNSNEKEEDICHIADSDRKINVLPNNNTSIETRVLNKNWDESNNANCQTFHKASMLKPLSTRNTFSLGLQLLSNNEDSSTGMETALQVLVPAPTAKTNTSFLKANNNKNCSDDSVHAASLLIDASNNRPPVLNLVTSSLAPYHSNYSRSDTPILNAAKLQKRQSSTKCQCPNCIVDDSIKTRSPKGQPLHRCAFINCGKFYTRTDHLKRHLNWHSGKKKFICAACEKKFVRKDKLTEHVKTHMNSAQPHSQCTHYSADAGEKNICPNQKLYKCHFSNCGKLYTRTDHLKRHLDWHIGKKNFICADCDKRFVCKDKLAKHVETHMNLKQTECKLLNHSADAGSKIRCPKTNLQRVSKNASRQDTTSSLKVDKPKKRVGQSKCRCPYCSEEDGNKIKGPNGKLQHICHVSYCKKVYNRASSLMRHLLSHSGKKTFICAYCDKTFARKGTLKLHVMTHMTDKQNKGRWMKCQCANCIKGGKKTECLENRWQHACPYCEKAYTNLSNLKTHLHSHSDEKKYFCDHCNKGFTRKDKLGWHMNIHTKEGQKWTRCCCPNCLADDDNKIRAANGKLQHICHIPNCGKLYTNSWILKRHLETHSGKKNYFCPHCGKGYARQDSFDCHLKRYNETKQKEVNEILEYVCSVRDCKRVFKSLISLNSHSKFHNKKHDNEGFARKNESYERGNRSMNTKQNKAKRINHVDTQITENGQAAMTLKRTNIEHNLGGSQLTCKIKGCGEVYDSINRLNAHLKYFHRA